MNFNQQYEKEFLAFRYAVMCQNSDTKIKAEGYKKLLELCKKLKWVYLQDELLRSIRTEPNVSQMIGNTIMDSSIKIIELSQLEDIDAFFIKLNPKDAHDNSHKIREYALAYFSKGNFSQYNNIFSRYIKNMRNLNDSEMNDFIVKYLVSSVIKRNNEMAISDITQLRQTYLQYDLNIYIYLLRLISGNFVEAAESVLHVNQNIYEDVWKIVTESDLAFYFMLSLLIVFNRRNLKEIQNNNQTLINKFFDEFPNHQEFLENYSKCRYELILEEFEKIQELMKSDPLLTLNFHKFSYEVKNNILKEILKSCQSVSLEYLMRVLKEKDSVKIENWILTGISEGYLKVRIDDVDKIIYNREDDSSLETINKTLDFSRKTLNNSMNRIFSNICQKNISTKNADLSKFKKYNLEKGENIGRGYYEKVEGDVESD